MLALAAALAFRGWPWRSGARLQTPRAIWFWLALWLVPGVVAGAYSAVRINVWDARYLGVWNLAAVLGLAWVMANLSRGWRLAVAACCLLAFALPLTNQWRVYGYADDWRWAARTLRETLQPNSPLAVYPPWNETPLRYYLGASQPIVGLPGHYDPISGRTEPYFTIDHGGLDPLKFRVPNNSEWGLLLVDEGAAQARLRDWFESNYYLVRSNRRGSLGLYVYRRNAKAGEEP
jgi:hypothetical protein